jgi:hypothetical protein
MENARAEWMPNFKSDKFMIGVYPIRAILGNLAPRFEKLEKIQFPYLFSSYW